MLPGLSNTQITEAYEAMRAGDYTKMASYFDTSSPVDGAVFWSGNKEGLLYMRMALEEL